MPHYIATREGVYNQGILGVFTTLELAQESCLAAEVLEPDDYHRFYVQEIELDVTFQSRASYSNTHSTETRKCWRLDPRTLTFNLC